MSAGKSSSYSATKIAARVAALGRQISREYGKRRLDVVVILDHGYVFAADLLRHVNSPVVCHFVRAEVRDVEHSGLARREVQFTARPELQGRDVLVLDAVIESGVTHEFLLRRLGESRPRSLRLAVLLDKPAKRRVALEPDYFGFRTASKGMWVGYGLAAPNGTGRNLRHLSAAVSNLSGGRGPKK
ncbi:MAG TPA: phosphoribosyltransferase family protein [Candidatus Acidoferrum sp.]|nr:phosphoribosyltransferase family protein [Candidatus Acidoferrum sp.]